jgi:hypothetical protein
MRWLISLQLCFLSGCATSILFRAPSATMTRQVTQTHHLAFWGWWEVSPPVELDKLCGPGDWSMIKTSFTPTNIAIGVVTAGLYLPATVEVHCQEFQSRR